MFETSVGAKNKVASLNLSMLIFSTLPLVVEPLPESSKDSMNYETNAKSYRM